MTTEIPMTASERWRADFIDRILFLANYEADTLQVADWAIEAQQQHGGREPVDVADQEWQSRA